MVWCHMYCVCDDKTVSKKLLKVICMEPVFETIRNGMIVYITKEIWESRIQVLGTQQLQQTKIWEFSEEMRDH